tara:strand:- start:105 stop:470 length:366 start_codon:yes stop_codon:yes gene_type:complete
MAKREFPFDPLQGLRRADTSNLRNRPDTLIQAIQQSSPYTEPFLSKEEQAQLQEVVLNALEELDEWEIWLINALLFERRSLREVQRMVGIPKTTVARKRDQILSKLRDILTPNQTIKNYLS